MTLRMNQALSRVLALVLGLASISHGFQPSLAALRPHSLAVRSGLTTASRYAKETPLKKRKPAVALTCSTSPGLSVDRSLAFGSSAKSVHAPAVRVCPSAVRVSSTAEGAVEGGNEKKQVGLLNEVQLLRPRADHALTSLKQ
jgi:hypothetical protein